MRGAAAGDAPGPRSGARGGAVPSGPAWEFRPTPVFLGSSSEEEEEEEEWTGHSQGGDLPNGDSQPSYNFCGFKKSFLCKDPVSARLPQRFLDTKMHIPSFWKQPLTAEEAERNAEELVAEEERAKKKVEKKKLKKKRQKERKRQEKLLEALRSKEAAEAGSSSQDGAAGSDGSSTEEPKGCAECGPSARPAESAGRPGERAGAGGPGAGSEEALEDDLDLSCTFVSKAWQKAGVKLPSPAKEKPAGTEDALPGKRPQQKVPEPLDTSALERSLVLADLGNDAAQKGLYAEAVQAFTAAVELNPREHRLFGNRSYCYEKLQRYEEALRDAQACLSLQPRWPKGLFRKGKALRGLKRYSEAARAFEELLRLDSSHVDAAAQLEQCRALLQQSSVSSPGAVPLPSPLPSLLGTLGPSLPVSVLLRPAGERLSGSCCDADRDGFVTVTGPKSHSKGQAPAAAAASKKQTLPSQHPARDCYPLWVGNLTAGVTKQALQSCFSRFGQIRFIRVLPERRCAFVNFAQKEAAEAAYRTMLDQDVQGTRLALQLKHPSHATPPPGRHKPNAE